MFGKILYLSILLVEFSALSEQDGLLQTDQIKTTAFGDQGGLLHTDQIENMKLVHFHTQKTLSHVLANIMKMIRSSCCVILIRT